MCRARILLLAVLPAMLGACSQVKLFEHGPATGYENSAYPAVGVTPPDRTTKPLTEEERKAKEEELKRLGATHAATRSRAIATSGDAPNP